MQASALACRQRRDNTMIAACLQSSVVPRCNGRPVCLHCQRRCTELWQRNQDSQQAVLQCSRWSLWCAAT